MARSLSETPDPVEIFEVYDSASNPAEGLKLFAAAFPNARTDYLAALFDERATALGRLGERIADEAAQIKAVRDFLARACYANIAEGCQHLGLQPQELWDKIMREANLPPSEMPETIQVR